MPSEIPERFEFGSIDDIVNLVESERDRGTQYFASLMDSVLSADTSLRGMPCPINTTPSDESEPVEDAPCLLRGEITCRWIESTDMPLSLDEMGFVTTYPIGGIYGGLSPSVDNGEPAYDPDVPDKTLDEYMASWDALIREVRDSD